MDAHGRRTRARASAMWGSPDEDATWCELDALLRTRWRHPLAGRSAWTVPSSTAAPGPTRSTPSAFRASAAACGPAKVSLASPGLRAVPREGEGRSVVLDRCRYAEDDDYQSPDARPVGALAGHLETSISRSWRASGRSCAISAANRRYASSAKSGHVPRRWTAASTPSRLATVFRYSSTSARVSCDKSWRAPCRRAFHPGG